MSAVQGQTGQLQFSAKGVKAACVVEVIQRPTPDGMFGRLYNARLSFLSTHSWPYNISQAQRIHPPMPMWLL